MGIDESDITRLLAGDVPSDDPQLGQVSAFLGSLKATYPPSSVTALEDHHLAVVAREVRAVGASRLRDRRDAEQRSSKRLRRTLAAFGAGVIALLTAGVGVASAMGLNPLEFVPGLVAQPSVTPGATAPTGVPGNGQQASHAAQPSAADPSTPPAAGQPNGKPSASPSATHGTTGNCGNGKGAGSATCTKGNSGKDNSGNGKSNGTSGNGNSGASTTPGSHSSNGSGNGKSGTSGNGSSSNGKSNKAAASATPTAANGNGKGKTTSSTKAGDTTGSRPH